jgi:SAM-dependent methyltransferase
MSQDHIKEYWEQQAHTHADSHWASWGDHWMIDLEIETIGKHIGPHDRVLDIGCANGFSAFRQAELRKPSSITGVDFASAMIDAAKRSNEGRSDATALDFHVGDVRALEFADNTFDIAYTTRVLINLPTWEQQKQGIDECLRVVKPNGLVVLSEGFWEPLVLLNAMRALKALPPLVEHDFNRYLKMSSLDAHLGGRGLHYDVEDFSSIYYLGSRFLRELVTDPSAYPGFSNPVNERFFALEREFSGGGFGIQQAIVIRKPAA